MEYSELKEKTWIYHVLYDWYYFSRLPLIIERY